MQPNLFSYLPLNRSCGTESPKQHKLSGQTQLPHWGLSSSLGWKFGNLENLKQSEVLTISKTIQETDKIARESNSVQELHSSFNHRIFFEFSKLNYGNLQGTYFSQHTKTKNHIP
jgi:hypothetical protein